MNISTDFLEYIKKELQTLYKAPSILDITCCDSEEGFFGIATYAHKQVFKKSRQKLFTFNKKDGYLYFQKKNKPSIENLECTIKSKRKFEGSIL